MMEEDFISILLADPDISAIVQGRIFWVARSQGSGFPAIRLQTVSRVGDYTTQEASAMEEARIQIDCFAEKYETVRTLARYVVDRISGMRETYGSTIFQGGFLDGERDGYEEQANVYRISIDLRVFSRKV